MTPVVGVVFRPQSPPEELGDVARYADEAGVPELWLWEDCFLESGIATAAASLAWTQRLTVGVGLFPAPLRNPALLAMELATLERLFPGRLTATVGHGVRDWMVQVGNAPRSQMTLLGEYVDAVRALLAGEPVTASGDYVNLDAVQLEWLSTTRPLLLVGARGPKTVALAAERSDGVLLDSVADEATVRLARDRVDECRSAAGIPGRGVVAVYVEVEAAQRGDLGGRLRDLALSFTEAGADRVIFQASASAPDARPLVDALVTAELAVD